jgi:hypothetical protein
MLTHKILPSPHHTLDLNLDCKILSVTIRSAPYDSPNDEKNCNFLFTFLANW